MFSKYELQLLREAVLSDIESWNNFIDRGGDVSEEFIHTLYVLEEKLWKMIEESK